MYPSLFFPVSTSKSPKHYTETISDESKGKTVKRPWDLRNTVTRSPGFPFSFHVKCSRLGAKEVTTQKHQKVQGKKGGGPLFLAKGPGNEWTA